MPMIQCPDCEKQISDSAPTCPNCGRPNIVSNTGNATNGTEQKRVTIWLGICIFFLPFIFSWFTLKKGYSTLSRILAFGWLALALLAALADDPGKPESTSVTAESESAPKIAEITESDLVIFGDMKKYKSDLVIMLNRLAEEYPACIKRIAPEYAGISAEKSRPGNPSFFVHCGDKDVPEVVRFTLNDIKSGKVPTPAKAIDPIKGLEVCASEAKRRVKNPFKVVFPGGLFDDEYHESPNKNVTISRLFTIEDNSGAKHKFLIYCYFDGQQNLTDATVKPFQ